MVRERQWSAWPAAHLAKTGCQPATPLRPWVSAQASAKTLRYRIASTFYDLYIIPVIIYAAQGTTSMVVWP